MSASSATLSPGLRAVLLVGLREKAMDPELRVQVRGFLDQLDGWTDEQLAVQGCIFLGTDSLLPHHALELDNYLARLEVRPSGR